MRITCILGLIFSRFGDIMKTEQHLIATLLSALFFTVPTALADIHALPSANAHAPIGIMGDHTHKQNEWMFSYRFMTMEMEGNRLGSSSISPEAIATTVLNPNLGPNTLRVVPTKMSMDMHMFGAMYAPTNSLTLMMMANYIEKDMDHITFQGMAGTNRLGTFTTKSKGWGDTKVSGLLNIYDTHKHKVHLNLGVSLPTGSIY